jgi:mRNA interferase MazF
MLHSRYRMEKDFDRWNEHKKALEANPVSRVYVHERELWFVHLGTNIGFEQDGRGDESLRPVLVLRKFNNEIVWALPLTRRDKPGNPYYVSFEYVDFPEVEGSPLRSSVAILSQLRLLDGKRFRYKVGTVPADAFATIKQKTRQLLA